MPANHRERDAAPELELTRRRSRAAIITSNIPDHVETDSEGGTSSIKGELANLTHPTALGRYVATACLRRATSLTGSQSLCTRLLNQSYQNLARGTTFVAARRRSLHSNPDAALNLACRTSIHSGTMFTTLLVAHRSIAALAVFTPVPTPGSSSSTLYTYLSG
ncbi:hypothetical protein BC629DRAFT_1437464 [Irpex lacteus]|nr:hypothetical protein BC629DRAFT_1437464 [Irpex lacteus]